MRWPRLRPSSAAAPGDRSASGERMLASAATGDGLTVVGTRHSVLVRAPDGSVLHRWPWADVRSAGWDAAARTLTLRAGGGAGTGAGAVSFVLAGRAESLVDLVHERVSASVVLVREVKVPGGLARVVARRRPAGLEAAGVERSPSADPGLEWAVEVDAGVDPDDVRVRALLREAAAAAAEELGGR